MIDDCLLKNTGTRPVRKGEICPWINGRCVDFLLRFEHAMRSWSVFEYGSGLSTVWFAKRCKEMVTVDENRLYHQAVLNELMKNKISNVLPLWRENYGHVDLKCTPYSEAINEDNRQYDLIIIDGRNRVMCALNALRHLKPKSWLLIDNTNWPKMQRLNALLNELSYDKHVFPRDWQASREQKYETTIWSMNLAYGTGDQQE